MALTFGFGTPTGGSTGSLLNDTSTAATPAAGSKPLSLSNLGIGGSSTLGSGTAFQPVLASLGTKAAMPGGVNTGTTNTLTSKQTAPASQQQVTGGSTGALLSQVNPNAALQTPGTMGQAPTTTYQPQTGALGQIASGLANTSAAGTAQGQAITSQLQNRSAQGSPAQQQITSQLQNTSNASSPAATAAQQATAQAGQLNPALAQNAANTATQFGQMGQTALNAAAPQLAGLATMGGGPIGLGQAGAIQNTVANYLQGLQSAENLQLNPNAQELTAANQQATAETAAGNLANTQQANIQSGLTSAGDLANAAQSNVQSGLNQAGGLAQNQQQLTQQGLQAAGSLSTPGNATQQVAPGSSVLNANNQQVYSGLGSLSQYQSEQLSNAQRGTYGAQSQSISTGLAAMSNTYQNVQAIAQANGINPTQYPTANGLISALQANITSPGGQAAFTEAMNALKTQIAQQVQNFASTGAITPTVSSSYTSALNSTNLSPQELGQLYDAVTATGLANLNADATAFNQSNAATNSATLPASFGSSQAQPSTYTPPANIQGAQTFTDNQGNNYQLTYNTSTGLWESN